MSSFSLDLKGSIGSLDTMANAMLEEDFKSSHPDLTIWSRDNDENSNDGEKLASERQFGNRESIDETHDPNEGGNSSNKKSDIRSVVIQVPPKRRKLDPSITVHRLVHGTSEFGFKIICKIIR